jgi:hypothetical protein
MIQTTSYRLQGKTIKDLEEEENIEISYLDSNKNLVDSQYKAFFCKIKIDN